MDKGFMRLFETYIVDCTESHHKYFVNKQCPITPFIIYFSRSVANSHFDVSCINPSLRHFVVDI